LKVRIAEHLEQIKGFLVGGITPENASRKIASSPEFRKIKQRFSAGEDVILYLNNDKLVRSTASPIRAQGIAVEGGKLVVTR
jgi:hypothetical protein